MPISDPCEEKHRFDDVSHYDTPIAYLASLYFVLAVHNLDLELEYSLGISQIRNGLTARAGARHRRWFSRELRYVV